MLFDVIGGQFQISATAESMTLRLTQATSTPPKTPTGHLTHPVTIHANARFRAVTSCKLKYIDTYLSLLASTKSTEFWNQTSTRESTTLISTYGIYLNDYFHKHDLKKRQ